MKKIFFLVALLTSLLVTGQDADRNHTKTVIFKKPTSAGPIDILNPAEATQEVVYYDGLGRPIQRIAYKQSSSGKDIITFNEFDQYGRQVKEFLPYTNQTPSLSFNINAATDVLNYYNTTTYGNTLNPYSEKLLETSPLNRVLKQGAPGEDWQISATGSDHSVKTEYSSNSDNEVKFYKATTQWISSFEYYDPLLINENSVEEYESNMLYKTVIKDENWTSGKNNTTEEFKDKDGRVVLKRTYADYGEASEVPHDTYYVYDIYGNLTYVIPPLVNLEDTIDKDVLAGLCYQYKYDHRNRMVAKKIPGKQWEFIVYDRLNRVVSTGPALNPWGSMEEGWLFTKYDDLNRVAYTGWHKNIPATAAGRKLLSAQYLNATISEMRDVEQVFDNVSIAYSNYVYPKVGKLLTYQYYDTYDFPNAPTIPSQVLGQNVYFNSTVQPRGLQTFSWNRILTDQNDTKSEISYNFYDKYSRVLSTYIGDDLHGGFTKIDSQVDFIGNILKTETQHARTGSQIPITITDSYEYTPQSRLALHTQKINQYNPQLIASNIYDEVGQLTSKKVGNEYMPGIPEMQKIDYTYNVRGWLTGLNNEQSANDPGIALSENDLFGYKIMYNTEEGEPIANVNKLYNGNISATLWKSSSDNIVRKYSYQYDNLNRLLKATYQKPESETWHLNSYNESLTYDKNGNILTLLRNGDRDTDIESIGTLPIDDLVYEYHERDQNKLIKVFDQTPMSQGFDDDSDGTSDMDNDYEYDENGNVKMDQNKGIENILYNHLNLPLLIQFSNTNNIKYLYTATGSKIQKIVTDNIESNSCSVDYLNGFQYKDGLLKQFFHPEGYVNVGYGGRTGTIAYYNYVFNYTDHLGNIRLSYGEDPATGEIKVIEENHYYPFGLKHTNYNSDWLMYQKDEEGTMSLKRPGPEAPPMPFYKYKYHGQERQDELGLNWDSFKWRNYDYTTARFMSIDPLAEDYTYNSPYAFAENKIGMGRELEGCELGPLWGPMAGVMLETTNTPPLTSTMANVAKTTLEVSAKTAEVAEKVEVHHVVPRQLKGHEVVEAAREEGFKFEGAENKIPLSKFSRATGKGQHGSHPKYNSAMKEKIDAGPGEGVSPADFIRNLVNETKEKIINNPDKKVNDMFEAKAVIDNTRVDSRAPSKTTPAPRATPSSKAAPAPEPTKRFTDKMM